MEILAALLVLKVAALLTSAGQLSCSDTVQCPCGTTGKNVTVCAADTKDDLCRRLSECLTCQDGLDRCLECIDGRNDSSCSPGTGQPKFSRQKRQNNYIRTTYLANQRRPPSSRYQQGSVQQGGGVCPELNSPKLGSIRCLSTNQVRNCVGKCLPGYSFEGRGPEYEITLTCTNGVYTPLREFPPCKSGGHCDLVVQGSGSFNCTTGMDGTLCDIICSGRFVGRFFCYPGHPWTPDLPHCMRPKVEKNNNCQCQYSGRCDYNGNCVCPVGRTGRNCESMIISASPDTSLKFCQDPGSPANGSRRPQAPSKRRGYPQGTQLSFSCNQGYDLEGEKSLFCTTSGRWSSERPKCTQYREREVVENYCPNPGTLSNGKIAYNPPPNSRRRGQSPADADFPEGGRLQYSCNSGYIMEGTDKLTCLPDGGWSAPVPSCSKELIYCPNPGPISNGKITYHPPLNSRRRSQGSSELDDPEFPEDGRLQYTCNRGYVMEGSEFLTCKTNGRWSAAAPSCEKVVTYCPNPGSIIYGKIQYYPPLNSGRRTQGSAELDDPEFPEGGRLEYTCHRAYVMEGTESLTCQGDGRWSALPPTCSIAFPPPRSSYCYNPGPIPNGRVEAFVSSSRQRLAGAKDDDEEYPRGTRLQYSCNIGYRLEGPPNLTCEAQGQWSAELPLCTATDPQNMLFCSNPGPILNGQIRYFNSIARPRTGFTSLVAEDSVNYPEGTRLEYECGDGYIMEGAFQSKCQSNGDWSNRPPKCVADCGRSIRSTTRRILEGNKTDVGEWPWVVGIGIRQNNVSRLICGGAVLNTQTIITAAHCLSDANQFVLYFGKYHLNDSLDDAQVLVRTSDRLIVHEAYNKTSLDNDIALVKFKPKINFSDRIQPICLPSAETTAYNLVSGKSGYVTGWGTTEKALKPDELLKAKLPYVSINDCMDSFRRNIENFTGSLTQNMFCAGYKEDKSQATCSGDSGGPFVFYDSVVDRYTLEGLVSFGAKGQCGRPGMYSVFTKVYRFMPWIYRNI